MNHSTQEARQIARLNDEYRRTCDDYDLTSSLLEVDCLDEIIEAVMNFDNFNDDNDPWCEHDFGSVTVQGTKYLWKIDYFDEYLRYWCDPLSEDCRRMLTIMCSDEY